MKITTEQGNEMDVLWMEGPTMTDGSVWVKLRTNAPLYETARFFETSERIEREETKEKPAAMYEGLKLVQVQRENDGTTFVMLKKESA